VTAETFGFGANAAAGERPLLTILGEYSDLSFGPAHTPAHYTDLLFGTERRLVGSVAGRGSVYDEMSESSFYYLNAGVLGPFTHPDDPSTDVDESEYACAYGTAPGCEAYRGTQYIRENTVKAAAAAGFDFARYDRDGDRCVREEELTVLLIFAEPAGTGIRRGAQTAPIGPVPVGGDLYVCTNSAGMGEAASTATIAHELSHTLGLVDVYGSGGSRNFPYSLMGATVTAPEDDLIMFHLDPYNKLRLGWLRPEILTVDTRGCFELRAAETVVGPEPEAYLVYDPARGTNEYFLLEHRLPMTLNYDGDPWFTGRLALPDQGLAVWYVKTDAAGVPLLVPDIFGTGGQDRALYIIPPVGFPGTRPALWNDWFLFAARPLWLNLDGTAGGTPSGLVVRVKSPVRRITIQIALGDPEPLCLEPPLPVVQQPGTLAAPDDRPCRIVDERIVCTLRRPGLVAVRRVPANVAPGASFTVEWSITIRNGGPSRVHVVDRLPDGFKGRGELVFSDLVPGQTQRRSYRARADDGVGRYAFPGVAEFRPRPGAALRRLSLRSVLVVFDPAAVEIHGPRPTQFPPIVAPPIQPPAPPAAPPEPDLVITAVSATGFTVKNIGDADAGRFWVRVTSAQFQNFDFPNGLPAGAEASVSFGGLCGQAGTGITATADVLGEVNESNEGNNSLTGTC
jgi:M6 family metalloprotease-like protein